MKNLKFTQRELVSLIVYNNNIREVEVVQQQRGRKFTRIRADGHEHCVLTCRLRKILKCKERN